MSIYPYYIDVPMLVTTATSLVARLRSGADADRAVADELATLAQQVTLPRAGDPTWPAGDDAAEERREAREHLELGLAVRTVELLRSKPESLHRLPEDTWTAMSDDTLIEIVGELARGYVDRVLDSLDAIILAEELSAVVDAAKDGRKAPYLSPARTMSFDAPIVRVREALHSERRRMSFQWLRLEKHGAHRWSLVVQARHKGVRGMQPAELQGMTAHVIGRLIRYVPAGLALHMGGPTSLGFIDLEALNKVLETWAKAANVALDLGEPFLSGPVAVIAPVVITA